MVWILETGLWNDDGVWDDTDVWVDGPTVPPVVVLEPWILATGYWNDNGYWDDTDVWKDGPTIIEQGIVMITPIFEKISNYATWRETVRFVDVETDEEIDLSTDVDNIVITLRDPRSGYEALRADLTDGDVYLLTGNQAFEWRFEADSMRNLDPIQYEIGGRVEIGTEVGQFMLGKVNIVRGL